MQKALKDYRQPRRERKLQKLVRHELFYSPETGVLLRKRTGKPLVAPKGGGGSFNIKGLRMSATRLIWLYVYGRLPSHMIYHRNGDQSDFRLANLYLKATENRGPLTQARLKEVMHYDPETGIFCDNGGIQRSRRKGGRLGNFDRDGYELHSIDGRMYKAHRLAWLYVYGCWPVNQIDHINRDTADNRIANLRQADKFQNMANAAKYATNTSGFKGVTLRRDGKKWVAQICVQGKRKNLGSFDTREEAHAVYCEARLKASGEFARFD